MIILGDEEANKESRKPFKEKQGRDETWAKKREEVLRILRLIRGPLYWNMSHNKYKKSKDTDGLCSRGEILPSETGAKNLLTASALTPRRDGEQLSSYAFDLLILTSTFEWKQSAPQGSTSCGFLPSPLLPALPLAVGREVGAGMRSMPGFRVGSARKDEGRIKMSCTTCIQLNTTQP